MDSSSHGHSHGSDASSHGHSHGGLLGIDTSHLLPCACWKTLSSTARSIVLRVILRLVMIGILIGLIRAFPGEARAAGVAVLTWLSSLGSPASEFAYFGVATAFCSVSPTGYLPAIATGIAYGPAAAIPITYASVNLGALVNAVLVRGICKRKLPGSMAGKYAARGATLLGSTGLARALKVHPIRIVALLRTPFLGNGALNYILSLHNDLTVTNMAIGNAIGLIPGSVLFPVAGNQLRSLGALLANGTGEGSERDKAIGWFIGISVIVGVSMLAVISIVKRVLAKDEEVQRKEAAEAAEAAAVAFVPSIVVYSDDDIKLLADTFGGGMVAAGKSQGKEIVVVPQKTVLGD
jgi:uncharacterized membrane protein YdjX (TVP38/TMEM64 family)